jgi:hypothetical protein
LRRARGGDHPSPARATTVTARCHRTGSAHVQAVDASDPFAVMELVGKCRPRVIIDGSVGNRAVAEAPVTCEHDDPSVTVTRWMLDIDPDGTFVAYR